MSSRTFGSVAVGPGRASPWGGLCAVAQSHGKKTPIIGFRLDANSQQRLEEIGRASGVSVHEAARNLVHAGLSETKWQGVHERIAEVNAKIDHLLNGLARGVEILLMSTGKVKKDEAQGWADRNIRK